MHMQKYLRSQGFRSSTGAKESYSFYSSVYMNQVYKPSSELVLHVARICLRKYNLLLHNKIWWVKGYFLTQSIYIRIISQCDLHTDL
jgi:hypothetical protein